MSYSNRFFLFQNQFTPNMVMGSDPRFGGDGTGSQFLEVPVLLVGKYSDPGLRTNGFCYFRRDKNKPTIRLSPDFFNIPPSRTYCYFNYNNFPCYCIGNIAARQERYLYRGFGRDGDDAAVTVHWVYSNAGDPLGHFNVLYPLASQRDGITYEGEINNISMGTFIPNLAPPQIPVPDVEYEFKSAYIAKLPTSTGRQKIFNSSDEDHYYYPAEDAIDITKVRSVEELIAGKWETSSGEKLYLGLPFFDITFKEYDPSAKTYHVKMARLHPVESPEAQIVYEVTPSGYESFGNHRYVYETVLLVSDDSLFRLVFIREQTIIYDGTGYVTKMNYRLIFNADNATSNRGYYFVDLGSSGSNVSQYYADEEHPELYNALFWINDTGTVSPTEHLVCSYAGSRIDAGMFRKYKLNSGTGFAEYTMKSPGDIYHNPDTENAQ